MARKSRRKPLDKVILDFREVHADRYSYDNITYVDNKTPISITCKVHGDFLQSPYAHRAGQGCPKCANTNKSTEQFLAEIAKDAMLNFDYSESVYVNNRTKVKVICKEHGVFYASPRLIRQGKGCVKCKISKMSKTKTRASTQEEFISDCREAHGMKYDYSETIYTSDNKVIKIICPVHGLFTQLASSHLHKVCGCSKCMRTGYNTGKRGSVYILMCGDVVKVGITNKTVDSRARQISLSYGSAFEVVTYLTFANGSIPLAVETQIHKELREHYEQPTEKFDGYTECFLNVDVGSLITRIGQIAGEQFNQLNKE